MSNQISYDRVRELFDYHEDGYLIFKKKSSSYSHVKIGDIAGSLSITGYYQIGIDGKVYRLHRIIFLWHHEYLPEMVSHEDRVKTHNWIDNLKDIS